MVVGKNKLSPLPLDWTATFFDISDKIRQNSTKFEGQILSKISKNVAVCLRILLSSVEFSKISWVILFEILMSGAGGGVFSVLKSA